MAIGIEITLDTPPPEACPTTFIELVALLNELVSGNMEGPFTPYITGAATPSVDSQDKVWHRQDAQGRPLGTYVFYSGDWRKQYSGNTDEVRFFTGDPADHFDGTGKGIVAGNWDGWALMNGQNGTDNLSDKFIVIGKVDDLAVGYANGTGPWKTTVDGTAQQTGGVKDITLSNANTYRPAIPALVLGKWEADGNTPNVAGDLIGLSGGGSDFNLIDADSGQPTPPAIPTLPPFYAMAACQWIGYD